MLTKTLDLEPCNVNREVDPEAKRAVVPRKALL